MYAKNDTVIYQGSGICKIEDIRKERFGKTSGEYYVLIPLFEKISSRYFVPVGSENGKFRKVLGADEINDLFENSCSLGTLWVDDEKERRQSFSDIIKSGDRAKIIKMIGEICDKQREKKQSGAKLRVFDEQILKEAEKLIESEFAFVLGLDIKEVKPYILKKLKVSA